MSIQPAAYTLNMDNNSRLEIFNSAFLLVMARLLQSDGNETPMGQQGFAAGAPEPCIFKGAGALPKI